MGSPDWPRRHTQFVDGEAYAVNSYRVPHLKEDTEPYVLWVEHCSIILLVYNISIKASFCLLRDIWDMIPAPRQVAGFKSGESIRGIRLQSALTGPLPSTVYSNVVEQYPPYVSLDRY